MKNFIRKVLLFFLGFALLNLLYLLLIIKTDFTFMKRMESLNFQEPNHDILILGNSLGMDGIDSDIFVAQGYDCYNLALGGASIATSKQMLEEYIDKYNHVPKVCILPLGSYISNFNDKSIHPVVEFTSKNHHYSFSDLPITKFKSSGIELLKKIVSEDHRNAYLNLGQLRFSKTRVDDTNYNDQLVFPLEKFLLSNQLLEFIKLCDHYNIVCVIVEMPGFKNTRNSNPIGPYLFNQFKNNVYLFNLNNIEFPNWIDDQKHWIGNSHLNEIGAREFSNRFFDLLEENKILNN
jgi:hypothetical protein